jgi:hypothetical protein
MSMHDAPARRRTGLRRATLAAGFLAAVAMLTPILPTAPAQASPAGSAAAAASATPAAVGIDGKPVSATVSLHGRTFTITGVDKADLDAAVTRLRRVDAGPTPLIANPCNGARLLCLFQNSSFDPHGLGDVKTFTGAQLVQTGSIVLANVSTPHLRSWDNQMSAWGNDSGVTACWWPTTNARLPGHVMRSLGNVVQDLLRSENDTASLLDSVFSTCH